MMQEKALNHANCLPSAGLPCYSIDVSFLLHTRPCVGALQAQQDHDVRLEREVQEAEDTATAEDAARVARERATWQDNAKCAVF